ncbi:MAG: gamma-glutamylcyclotransferase [Gammaproteobacteria bacterium]|nr:gamma-glutamylcyclotransferase [Gammaproteobacteria bacterium]
MSTAAALHTYFAYGSNLHPLRLQHRAPQCRVVTVARLPGYRLAFDKRSLIDGSGKCNIHTCEPQSAVWGVVYCLSPAELARLDDEEVVHGGYQRIEVEVHDHSQGVHQVCTYQAPAELTDASLAPYDWYHALVIRGASHHGLPSEWIRRLQSIAAQHDHDRERRRLFDAFLAGL